MASPISASSSIDVQSLVGALVQVERKPLEQMKSEAKKIETKISAWGKIQSQLAAFRDAAAELAKQDTWRSVKATSGDPAAVEVTARAGAVAGRPEIVVDALAQSQTVNTDRFASSAAVVGGGTLTIQMGSTTGAGNFTADATRSVDVTIPAGATLAQVRDAINGSGSGVRASIVRDGDQVRLLVTGAQSGSDQAFQLSVTDLDGGHTDASGLSALAWDPALPRTQAQSMAGVRDAGDARYRIDGVALTARGNKVEGAMDGVDLVLKQVTPTPVQVEIAIDTDGLEASAKKFVDAYNTLNTTLVEQTRYDEATKQAGALQGDRSAVALIGQLRQAVLGTVEGGTLTRLSEAGITLQRNGSLGLKSADFRSAAIDPSRLENLFAASSTDPTRRGLMARLRDLGDRMTGTEGPVTTATESWRTRKTANQRRQDALELRVTDVEKRLLRQYSALDAQLAAAQQNSAALANALAGLPKL